MKDLFFVSWTGGYDAPQVAAKPTDVEAWALAEHWAQQLAEEDRIDIYRIDGSDLSVVQLGTL